MKNPVTDGPRIAPATAASNSRALQHGGG